MQLFYIKYANITIEIYQEIYKFYTNVLLYGTNVISLHNQILKPAQTEGFLFN